MEGEGLSTGEIRGGIAFVGVGSNMENPAERCREAVERLSTHPGIRLLGRSSFYRTEPVGPQDQPWFINAVAEIRTVLSPRQLFAALKEIERGMGRKEEKKWGPRLIDLDLLLYGQEVVREEGLAVPHPELHRRRFVLEPLCELASYAIHPSFGVSVRGLLDRLTDAARVELCDSTAAILRERQR
ncbi:MAG: 2-amino-4-hydroxy-6-hydroxymethyldihydropteridine diphosphokinase [Proteobacteria bacterium]|nr:2-amino-4-hydroxy-6-hydroxymethyldihydropteridine diphosphokinase [Pseudomonadota bacterium]MBU2226328.1 2-amino-4-hydroxy-6-hydroxymethyldihydropteridine diphosphokinase [Pseudomonadota bacterium]MBU2262771.1 2-amino-4-hydroxy-6-hydroxymethyldihydropteridine diphosphokinase [Pseudomonadota bacterium]